jgi:TolA-binding protein
LGDLICSKSLKELNEKEAAEASMKRARDLEQERLVKERMKETNQVQKRLQDLQQELQQRKRYQQEQPQQQQQQPQQQPLRDRPKKRKQSIASPVQLNGPNQTEPSRKSQKLKIGNVINAPLRGPPAVVSSAPNVQASSQRVSTMAVSAAPSKNKKTKTAQATAPMFHSGKLKKSAEPIVLTDTGTVTVKSKPNRVVIRSRNLGDPKDYDDAINNYKRTTPNPVTRRFYHGQPHLFYKNPDGVIVNVGPVELIKPLVTAFLLSS